MGHPLFDPADLRSRGMDHIRTVIRDEEPRTPSTRLTTLGAGLDEIAQHRRTDPQALTRTLRRELEWIPLKAMRKEPARRYQSASDLAADIENYLKGDFLLAGPESVFYRAEKFVQRHGGVVIAIFVIVVSLLIGLIVSTVSLVREQQARRVAVVAQEHETALRRRVQAEAYVSDIRLAQQALAMNDLGHARQLVDAHRPTTGEVDLRGWEWRYLWQECQSDALAEFCRYPDSVFSLAYSRDGGVLAVGGYSTGFIEIWDAPGRRRLATLQPNEGRLVAFSPHADLLATGAGNEIRLWQTATRELVRQSVLSDLLCVLRFSRDGTRLASLSYPDEVTVWDVDRWTIVRRVCGVRNEPPDLGSLDFSPDGSALVVGEFNHRLRVVDLASGNTDVNIPQAHPEPITSVAWSPDGSIIASASGYTGGPIRLWEAASGRPVGTLEGHTSWISELIFSTDSRRLYSAGADQTIRIWDVTQRQCLTTLRGSRDEVWGLALSPDTTTLASAARDGVVTLWDARPHPEEEQPGLIALDQPARPAFAPGGRELAIPCEGTVRLYDLATSEETEQLGALGADVSTVVYSPDGALLISGARSGRIRVWSRGERRMLRKLSSGMRQFLL